MRMAVIKKRGSYGMLGKTHNEETRKKMSQSRSGEKNPFYGRHLTPEMKAKLSASKRGKPSKLKGIPKSEEAKRNMSLAHRDNQLGERNGRWTGGISKLNHLIQTNYRFDIWKRLIFKRDDYKCQNPECKKTCDELHPHHIKAVGQSIKDHNLKTIQDAIKCSEIWDTNNGITLCKTCHRATDSYGRPFTTRRKTDKPLSIDDFIGDDKSELQY